MHRDASWRLTVQQEATGSASVSLCGRVALMHRWLSLNQAADHLGVSRASVYRLCKAGLLAWLEVPGVQGRRFREEDLDSLLEPGKLDELGVHKAEPDEDLGTGPPAAQAPPNPPAIKVRIRSEAPARAGGRPPAATKVRAEARPKPSDGQPGQTPPATEVPATPEPVAERSGQRGLLGRWFYGDD
jgi:excisionase family DNA binding protein